MCKQKINGTVKYYGSKSTQHQQNGFSLVMVMMIMVVIALLVIAGAQVSNTEMRISTNNADQKFAKGLAEKTLLEAEKEITGVVFASTSGTSSSTIKKETVDEATLKTTFPDNNCSNGLCGVGATTAISNGFPLWENNGFTAHGKEVDIAGGAEKPRYIVEYLGVKEGIDGASNIRVFRVTARATGQNPNTISTLQTVLVAPSS